MAFEYPTYLHCECEFGGKMYDAVFYLENTTQLKLELTDRITNEEWHNTLTESFVEELTKKTGNFKRFDVFCSMIQSALSKRSHFLKLDLLNYEDLNEIRRIKILNDCLPPQCPVAVSGNKRYLILSYITEFDKIHYPIPLISIGYPTPDVYRSIIHKLRVKLFDSRSAAVLSEQQSDRIGTCKTISKLQSENAALKQEILYMKESLDKVKSYHETHLDSDPYLLLNKAKHLELKTFVNNLETELFEAKSKSSRQMIEYTREIARLQADLEAAAITQRGMRRKITQLSEELCLLKGGSLHRKPSSPVSITHFTSNKLDKVSHPNRLYVLSRQKSQKPVFSHQNSRTNITKRRAGSASPTICRSISRGSSTTYNTCLTMLNKPDSYRQRTNSLDRALSGHSRFDPTAYVRERERQQEENALKRKLAQRQSIIGATSCQRSRSSSCLDTRYNFNVKNASSTHFARTSGATSPAFSSCESGLECTTRKSYPKINTNYDSIHRSPGCTYERNHSTNRSSPSAVLRASRSPANGYSLSNPTEPFRIRIKQNMCSHNLNKSRSPAPLNDTCISKSLRSRSNTQSPCLFGRHQVDSEIDSDLSMCSGRLSRRCQPRNRNIDSKQEKVTHDTDTELDEIDHRLNVLQGFFEKYLANS
ncbi:Coiled-coil domain-containing protein [Schistosoma japonicum]|nr:Coiled-coil domain-containing protein [Schistosoma japonicum]